MVVVMAAVVVVLGKVGETTSGGAEVVHASRREKARWAGRAMGQVKILRAAAAAMAAVAVGAWFFHQSSRMLFGPWWQF
jgi:hypothetical protein